LHEALHRLVLGDLFLGRAADGARGPASREAHGRQHCRGVDLLVERREDEGVATYGHVHRVLADERGRRRRELPGDGLPERTAGRGARARRYLRLVVGRHREPALGLEEDRLRSHPPPAAGRLGRDADGLRPCVEGVVRRERDHRLRERHAQVRRERDVAFGTAAANLERSRRRSLGRGTSGRRGEAGGHRSSRARRRKGSLAQREGLRILVALRKRGQALEHARERARVERLRGRPGDLRHRLLFRRTFAQTEDDVRLLG
jgi:hypothetical protein